MRDTKVRCSKCLQHGLPEISTHKTAQCTSALGPWGLFPEMGFPLSLRCEEIRWETHETCQQQHTALQTLFLGFLYLSGLEGEKYAGKVAWHCCPVPWGCDRHSDKGGTTLF